MKRRKKRRLSSATSKADRRATPGRAAFIGKVITGRESGPGHYREIVTPEGRALLADRSAHSSRERGTDLGRGVGANLHKKRGRMPYGNRSILRTRPARRPSECHHQE
jgi:hypothetical protein